MNAEKCAVCRREPVHTEEPDWIRFVGRADTVCFCPAHKGYLDTLQRVAHGQPDAGAIIYTYRGQIERGVGGGYIWRDAYSPTTRGGGILYPWMTRAVCQADAKRFGCRAVFVGRP